MVSQTSVCFLLSKNTRRAAVLHAAITEAGFQCRSIGMDASLNADGFLPILSGCVVVDVDSLRNGVASVSRTLMQNRVSLPVVAVSELDPRSTNASSVSKQAMRDGAFDVVSLSGDGSQLEAAVRAAIARDVAEPFSPSAMRRKLASLTARERQTIQLFLDGHNTKVVAKQLSITYQTVDKHRGRALRKVGFHTVVELQNALRLAMLSSMGMNLGGEPSLNASCPSSESVTTRREQSQTSSPVAISSPHVPVLPTPAMDTQAAH